MPWHPNIYWCSAENLWCCQWLQYDALSVFQCTIFVNSLRSVMHIYITEIGHYWSNKLFVVTLVPIQYLNNIFSIGPWLKKLRDISIKVQPPEWWRIYQVQSIGNWWTSCKSWVKLGLSHHSHHMLCTYIEVWHHWPFVRGIHWSLVDSIHKGPIMVRAFSRHDFLMVPTKMLPRLTLASWPLKIPSLPGTI